MALMEGLLAGGLGAGLLGSVLGASSASKAAKAQNAAAQREMLNRLLFAFGGGAEPYARAAGLPASMLSGAFGSPGTTTTTATAPAGAAGSRRLAARRTGGGTITTTTPGVEAPELPGGYIDELRSITEAYKPRTGVELDRYDRDSAALESIARRFGVESKVRVDRDAKRALDDANRATSASLAGAGLGDSTLPALGMSGNARRIFEAAGDQKSRIDDSSNSMLLDTVSRRSAGRTQLGLSALGQEIALSEAPVRAKMAALDNAAGLVPSVSPGAAAAGQFGNFLGALGGQAAGIGAYGLLSSMGGAQVPEWLRMYMNNGLPRGTAVA